MPLGSELGPEGKLQRSHRKNEFSGHQSAPRISPLGGDSPQEAALSYRISVKGLGARMASTQSPTWEETLSELPHSRPCAVC